MLANNIRTWADNTTPNYPILYVTRWIPFNAWYVSLTGEHKDADSIRCLKENPSNALYDRIKYLITGPTKTFECLQFRHELYELEQKLKNKDFPSTDEPIYFGVVEMGKNPDSEKRKPFNGYAYKAKRFKENEDPHHPNKSVVITIEKLGAVPPDIETINLNKHNWEELESKLSSLTQFKREQKKVIRKVFKQVEPNITIDTKDLSNGTIRIGNSRFCNNLDAISAMIIDVLYELRCKAAHGEIEYTSRIIPIYEHAFNMLNLITKTIN